MITGQLSGTALTVRGHAGFSRYGSDIVCAAASMLAFTLAAAMEEAGLQRAPEIESACGSFRIAVRPREGERALVEAVFAAIHRDGRLPRNPSAQELGTFFSSYGVDGDRFRAAMADPKVDARMDRAREFAIASGAEGTPTLVVNGRYRVTAASLEDALRITDWLVARERGRAGGGAKAAP